jgi:hypothetical protein
MIMKKWLANAQAYWPWKGQSLDEYFFKRQVSLMIMILFWM